jgi:hypothetical protein
MLTKWMLVVLLALPFGAMAQSKDKLVDRYKTFAGSEDNSKAVVEGLRTGEPFKLTDGKTTTTYDPPTGKMGNGNVNIALSLAEADLKKQGITNPTNAQLTAELDKILQQRADHKGWGQIAQSMGFKLGDVMRSEKAGEHAKDTDKRVARADRLERTGKPERVEKPERPERPE